jgi:hypothetical protein
MSFVVAVIATMEVRRVLLELRAKAAFGALAHLTVAGELSASVWYAAHRED